MHPFYWMGRFFYDGRKMQLQLMCLVDEREQKKIVLCDRSGEKNARPLKLE